MNDGPEKSRGDSPEWTEEMKRLLESTSLFEELGVEPCFAPDELAPPVDREKLRAHVRKDLEKDADAEVRRLIARYRPWFEAWQTVYVEEVRRRSAENP